MEGFATCRSFGVQDADYWQRIAARLEGICRQRNCWICLLSLADVKHAIVLFETGVLAVHRGWKDYRWPAFIAPTTPQYSLETGILNYLLNQSLQEYCAQVNPPQLPDTDVPGVIAWLRCLQEQPTYVSTEQTY